MNTAQRKALEYLAQTPGEWQPIRYIPNGRGSAFPRGATPETFSVLLGNGWVESHWNGVYVRITDAGLAALKENTP